MALGNFKGIAELLIIDSKDNEGKTPLLYAFQNKNKENLRNH